MANIPRFGHKVHELHAQHPHARRLKILPHAQKLKLTNSASANLVLHVSLSPRASSNPLTKALLVCPFVGDGRPRRVRKKTFERTYRRQLAKSSNRLSKQKKAAFGHRHVGTTFNSSLPRLRIEFLPVLSLIHI